MKIATLCAALLVGVAALSGCGGPPAEPVTAFVPMVASDKIYSGEAPQGWDVESGDIGGTVSKTTMSKGSATIRIVADTASSFLADGMRGSARPAIEVIHEKGLDKLSEYFSDPQIEPMVEMQKVLGTGRYSEFTADGGNTHGYRCTMQGGERMFYVTTSCAESDWKTLKPAFYRVIMSLKQGSA